MNVRWWRVAVVFEDAGEPCTWTLHVRAFTDESARRLVAQRVGARPFLVYACQPSEPLTRVANKEEIVADYGPYRRSWDDPMVAHLRRSLAPG